MVLGEGVEPGPGAGWEGADCEGSEAIVCGGAVAVLFCEVVGLGAGGTERGVADQRLVTDSCGDLGRHASVAAKANYQAEEQ